ncbi:MAG: hypothetical protein PHY93_21275 [Bacteriovorax sp.]|nr:hypothetical protein [Bacteriovorax sp.]
MTRDPEIGSESYSLKESVVDIPMERGTVTLSKDDDVGSVSKIKMGKEISDPRDWEDKYHDYLEGKDNS